MGTITRNIDPEKPYCVYKYTNLVNGKVYIGQTKQQLFERAHRDGTHYDKCPYFYNAILKYGWDNFQAEILEDNLTLEQANEKEVYWITYYNSYLDHSKGYNAAPGGSNMDREAHSKKLKEWWADAGNYARMKEVRAQQAKLDSFRQACSEGAKRKWAEPGHKEKMSQLRQKNPPKHTACICINTGEEFYMLKEAAQWAGLKSSTGILACCQGKRNYSGLHPETKEKLRWKFKEEEKYEI